jgi:hypothetical protein
VLERRLEVGAAARRKNLLDRARTQRVSLAAGAGRRAIGSSAGRSERVLERGVWEPQGTVEDGLGTKASINAPGRPVHLGSATVYPIKLSTQTQALGLDDLPSVVLHRLGLCVFQVLRFQA